MNSQFNLLSKKQQNLESLRNQYNEIDFQLKKARLTLNELEQHKEHLQTLESNEKENFE